MKLHESKSFRNIPAHQKIRNQFETLEEQFNEIHDHKYDYSNALYNGLKEKIDVICPIHGEFKISAEKHLIGRGCPACGVIKRGKTRTRLAKERFKHQAKKIHNNKYDYSKFNYINSSTKSIIICPVHGEFEQSANAHLNGSGCNQCGVISVAKRLSSNLDEMLLKCKIKHDHKYDYSEVIEYKNSRSEANVICPKHGTFKINLYKHSKGAECPKCKTFINPFKVERYKNRRTILYYVKIGEFYKIGLTVTSIESRFRYCDNVETIYFWEYEDGTIPWRIEKNVLAKTKDHKISKEESPIKSGYTEFRCKDIYDIIEDEVNFYENKKN